MDTSVFYNLPDFFAAVWNWCGNQDSRTAFLAGVVTWFALGRIFGLFGNPVQKVIAFMGFILVAFLALAFWVSFSGTLEPGEIPFGKATFTPNVDTLTEIQK